MSALYMVEATTLPGMAAGSGRDAAIKIALGSHEKKITDSEVKNALVARKSIVAKKNIQKDDFFTEENICAKRPGDGISPMHWEKIIGTKSKRDFHEDEKIEI